MGGSRGSIGRAYRRRPPTPPHTNRERRSAQRGKVPGVRPGAMWVLPALHSRRMVLAVKGGTRRAGGVDSGRPHPPTEVVPPLFLFLLPDSVAVSRQIMLSSPPGTRLHASCPRLPAVASTVVRALGDTTPARRSPLLSREDPLLKSIRSQERRGSRQFRTLFSASTKVGGARVFRTLLVRRLSRFRPAPSPRCTV